MKIWHVTSERIGSHGHRGGMGVHVFNLAKEQASLGHEVTVFCPVNEETKEAGFTIHSLELFVPVGKEDLANRLSASKLDVNLLVRKAQAEGKPDIVHGHEWDLADVYTDVSVYAEVPAVATMHISNIINMPYMTAEFTATAAYHLWWESEMLKRVDGMIAISEYMAGYYRFHGCKVPIRTIHNGITIEDFGTRKFIRPVDKIKAFWHGRFAEQKGLDVLIEAAEKSDKVFFFLAGEPNHESEEYYRRTSNTFRLKKLEKAGKLYLLGMLPQTTIGALLRACDVAVYPHHNAPFDLAVLEAMACGAKVVTTGVDAIGEYTTDGVDCIYCEQNADSMLDAIDIALKMEGMGERAAERARKMTWAKTAKETLDFYEEIINAN